MSPFASSANSPQAPYARWQATLRRLGLAAPAALILESAGPLTVLLAQAAALGQPFLPGPEGQALVDLLDSPDQARAFAAALREEPTP